MIRATQTIGEYEVTLSDRRESWTVKVVHSGDIIVEERAHDNQADGQKDYADTVERLKKREDSSS